MSESDVLDSFYFQQRHGRLNVRAISRLDIEHVVEHVDVTALQDLLENVAFCNLKESDLQGLSDQTVVKAFRVAQLIIEYLLNLENSLYTETDRLREENEELRLDSAQLRDDIKVIADENDLLRRDLKQKRKALATFEYVLTAHGKDGLKGLASAGLESTTEKSSVRAAVCGSCGKAFSSKAFLEKHCARRNHLLHGSPDPNDENQSPNIKKVEDSKKVDELKAEIDAQQKRHKLELLECSQQAHDLARSGFQDQLQAIRQDQKTHEDRLEAHFKSQLVEQRVAYEQRIASLEAKLDVFSTLQANQPPQKDITRAEVLSMELELFTKWQLARGTGESNKKGWSDPQRISEEPPPRRGLGPSLLEATSAETDSPESFSSDDNDSDAENSLLSVAKQMLKGPAAGKSIDLESDVVEAVNHGSIMEDTRNEIAREESSTKLDNDVIEVASQFSIKDDTESDIALEESSTKLQNNVIEAGDSKSDSEHFEDNEAVLLDSDEVLQSEEQLEKQEAVERVRQLERKTTEQQNRFRQILTQNFCRLLARIETEHRRMTMWKAVSTWRAVCSRHKESILKARVEQVKAEVEAIQEKGVLAVVDTSNAAARHVAKTRNDEEQVAGPISEPETRRIAMQYMHARQQNSISENDFANMENVDAILDTRASLVESNFKAEKQAMEFMPLPGKPYIHARWDHRPTEIRAQLELVHNQLQSKMYSLDVTLQEVDSLKPTRFSNLVQQLKESQLQHTEDHVRHATRAVHRLVDDLTGEFFAPINYSMEDILDESFTRREQENQEDELLQNALIPLSERPKRQESDCSSLESESSADAGSENNESMGKSTSSENELDGNNDNYDDDSIDNKSTQQPLEDEARDDKRLEVSSQKSSLRDDGRGDFGTPVEAEQTAVPKEDGFNDSRPQTPEAQSPLPPPPAHEYTQEALRVSSLNNGGEVKAEVTQAIPKPPSLTLPAFHADSLHDPTDQEICSEVHAEHATNELASSEPPEIANAGEEDRTSSHRTEAVPNLDLKFQRLVDTNPRLPAKPTSPKLPERPISPRLPEKPMSPKIPGRPVSPKLPDRPASPKLPERPVSPRLPEKPTSPQIPMRPTSPRLPARPNSPQLPDKPTSPKLPSRPASPDTRQQAGVTALGTLESSQMETTMFESKDSLAQENSLYSETQAEVEEQQGVKNIVSTPHDLPTEERKDDEVQKCNDSSASFEPAVGAEKSLLVSSIGIVHYNEALDWDTDIHEEEGQ